MNDRCMYFDYGKSEDEPNKVYLYETYEVRFILYILILVNYF